MHEFDIIQTYFTRGALPSPDLGVGDDAALLTIPSDQQLVITTDTLVENIHFLKSADARDIGYKALAVNLSDLAAMGATPAWATLALTLPQADPDWLKNFSAGFFSLADAHHVQLIGGNTTRGPLSITVQALGLVPTGTAITRSQAQPGDGIYVSHTLGDSGLALQILTGKMQPIPMWETALAHLYRPMPRISLGISLRSIAHAAIDISDGLAADLSHILQQSHVGAIVNVDDLPLSAVLRTLPHTDAIHLALTAGDDYELCVTLPSDKHNEIIKQCPELTRIGVITPTPGLTLQFSNGKKYHGSIQGYQHF